MVDLVRIRIVLVTALVGAVIGAGYTYVAHNALPVGLFDRRRLRLDFSVDRNPAVQGVAGARAPAFAVPCLSWAEKIGVYVVASSSRSRIFERLVVLRPGGDRHDGAGRRVRAPSLCWSPFSSTLCSGSPISSAPASFLRSRSGRYHRPRPEERALLFIDLCGSTAKAEQLGRCRGFSTSSTLSSPTCRATLSKTAAKSTSTSATRSSPPGAWGAAGPGGHRARLSCGPRSARGETRSL